MYRVLMVLVMLTFACSAAQAGQLEGIKVKDQITNANGTVLHLNGMGLREKLWFDIYVGSLYLATPSHDPDVVIGQQGPFRVRMDFLYHEISGEQMADAWQDDFEDNLSVAGLAKLSARIKQFESMFSDSVHKGDVFLVDYIPSQGTRVVKNGKLLGTIKGEDFKKALLAVWLGKDPADSSLKRGMLGIRGE